MKKFNRNYKCFLTLTFLFVCSQCTKSSPSTVTDGGTDGDSNTVPVWSRCGSQDHCIIVANSCCDVCGMPTLNDVDTINQTQIDEHFADVCHEENPNCPKCSSQLNPELVATCSHSGQCIVIDTGKEDFTHCNVKEDCIIRTPECCECGADMDVYSLIALNSQAMTDFVQMVCGQDSTCALCEPIYPENVEAICDTDNHCAVQIH